MSAKTAELTERGRSIVAMRNEGETYSRIGEQFSISANRARQIYFKQVRLQKEEQQVQVAWTNPLPLGFQQWFEEQGLHTKEDVRQAVIDGRIAERRNQNDRYSRITACSGPHEPANGWMRPSDLKLVVEWVGLPIDNFVVPKQGKELHLFLKSVKSGLPVGDAIQKHYCGPQGGNQLVVMKLLKAVTALDNYELDNLRRWVKERGV